jgi:hypothetical protein
MTTLKMSNTQRKRLKRLEKNMRPLGKTAPSSPIIGVFVGAEMAKKAAKQAEINALINAAPTKTEGEK